MTTEVNVADVQERFGKVMAARKTANELIGLFDRIVDSTKFSQDEKPYCFGYLLQRAAQTVPAKDASSLLAAIRRTEAMPEMRKAFSYDDAERISAAIVRRMLTSVPLEQEPLNRMLDALERAKVTLDSGNCMSLAVLAEMEFDTLERIAVLTDYAYDPKTDPLLNSEGVVTNEALF
ncbi:Tol-pal system protein [Novimethylophilus kurashikiensis]|uniref:Tol-pal system protein n=1 Tax=Novimethylophilus kurashikiensis TaxID=1825523 RepID=A0A2R5F8E5_9PROT|nr:hypothetical protein [Novimethylophilus kurashikiensis]GBG14520.1 Tol-pal system protein [Novimethylophilus kurashikiensis]